MPASYNKVRTISPTYYDRFWNVCCKIGRDMVCCWKTPVQYNSGILSNEISSLKKSLHCNFDWQHFDKRHPQFRLKPLRRIANWRQRPSLLRSGRKNVINLATLGKILHGSLSSDTAARGYVNAYWMKASMSGTPSCAFMELSTNSTIEWIMRIAGESRHQCVSVWYGRRGQWASNHF